jgi:aldehyde:ferredoxin oxidoreductase
MKRRLLFIDPKAHSWQLETLQVETLQKDPREDYFLLSGETLCQYLLRRDPESLIIARGPLPFISGNKASVGYVSPLTGLPHYSFVGGRTAAQLLNLGLDGICLRSDRVQHDSPTPYIVVKGRAPNLTVEFKSADELPTGQRSAYYWLLDQELDGVRHDGSILTIGEGARLGYRSANLAAEVIYHAGRGGVGAVFARFANGLVLSGEPLDLAEFFHGDSTPFTRNPNGMISSLLDKHCARLSSKTGGTITKLYTTGSAPDGNNSLPAWNARQLGSPLADLGSPRVLKATRAGQTGCHWCQVDCRHYHWVPADYAPDGHDLFLDDFEPTYAIFAMLGLESAGDTVDDRLYLLEEVDQRLILPLEQMGLDAIDFGVGLAALMEGMERGIIPVGDAPGYLGGETNLESAVQAVALLRSGQAAEFPALRAIGDGPQALAEAYPGMKDLVFTGGKGTLGNPGHCNALWTFLMPFSRFFGHYVGQFYKVEEELPPPGSGEDAYHDFFQRVVAKLLEREFFWLLANALSQCAFTFVIFSQDAVGEQLSEDDLLIELLRKYGIETTRADLEWFAQAFWAQSIDLKCQLGWQPPAPEGFPKRVYEALATSLGRSPEDLERLMGMLIEEWKRQAGVTLKGFGYQPLW